MVSLVVTTCNRVTELEELLVSLEAQTYKYFEVIVVDQNPDDRVLPILSRHGGLRIRRLSSGKGAARGRNAGLRAVEGDFVAFPDDDCWYPNHLLADVVQWFESSPEFDALVSSVRNPNDEPMVPKFPPRQGPCTKKSVMRCAMAVNLFLRKQAVDAVGFFREDMGPGCSSPYQSGEDLDYIVRTIEHGMGVWYQPSFAVYHPDLRVRDRSPDRTYSYAMSVGLVWRTHRFPWWWCIGDVVGRSLGGAAFHVCKGNFQAGYLYALRAAGQFRGYAFAPSTNGTGSKNGSKP